MIIEFADPGYNFLFLWLSIGLPVLGIALFLLPFFITTDETKIGIWPVFGLVICITSAIALPNVGAADYDTRVYFEKMEQIESLGFSNVELSGGRFTAATEDGEYFRGVLVDLEPDEGYAYQVLELTGTEN
ncbi:membrane protein [Microbacterium phage Cassita]|nr:membrane protein [Microbacterium phage Cassita]